MKYEITHSTRYAYSEPVMVGHNRLCLRPCDTAHQRVEAWQLEIEPAPERVHEFADRDGNHLATFDLRVAHDALSITSRCRVEVTAPAWPAPAATPAWEAASVWAEGAASLADPDIAPFAFASPFVAPDAEVGDYVRQSLPPGRPLLEGVVDLLARLKGDFAYDPHATEVSTHPRDAFRARRGVCQDFAHIVCAGLRALGLPARYVSGYLETRPPPGRPKLRGADASHAWVAVWCPGWGWIDLDPTNNLLGSASHITVAWGRDYGDVSPVAGVARGGGAHVLSVSVDVWPLE